MEFARSDAWHTLQSTGEIFRGVEVSILSLQEGLNRVCETQNSARTEGAEAFFVCTH